MNWVIISNEVSALGWRLSGGQQLIADERSVQEGLAEAARRDADLVLITADLAKHLPNSVLNAALLAEKPLIAVIPGLPSGSEPPDLEQEVRRVLWMGV
jgi:vacuolar-type H+-ATPase subunit F/Vma7